MKNKRLYGAIILGIILISVGFSIWWFQFRGPSNSEILDYTVVLESDVTPEGASLRLFRVVLHIASGTGPQAVKAYLSSTQTQGDLYEILTTQGWFIAVGEALQGDPGRIPQVIKERLIPWQESPKKIGKEGPYTIYQVKGP